MPAPTVCPIARCLSEVCPTGGVELPPLTAWKQPHRSGKAASPSRPSAFPTSRAAEAPGGGSRASPAPSFAFARREGRGVVFTDEPSAQSYTY